MRFFTSAFVLGLLGTASAFCGSAEPSEEGFAVHQDLQASENATHTERQSPDSETIQVFFHDVRYSTNEARLSEDRAVQQVAVLNSIFQGTPYSFQLAGFSDQVQEYSYPVSIGGEGDRQIKQTRQGDARTLNVWTVNVIEGGYAGYATFPWDYLLNSQVDGVVMNRNFITGGPYGAQYSSGKILGHEVGHWLGLFHTFQGGCNGGDMIDDTPAEASAATGCPVGRDTCALPGVDPIHNHMDYTNDPCRTGFTNGQITRMNGMFGLYRGLLGL
ncbi:pregnancy-associated plasma protein-A-domain-containing protein [Aspergillus filifer]